MSQLPPLLQYFSDEITRRRLIYQQRLDAIWLKTSVKTANKPLSQRLAPGDLIRVEYGRLVDTSENRPATHRILECWGNPQYNNRKVVLWSLDKRQRSILNIDKTLKQWEK